MPPILQRSTEVVDLQDDYVSDVEDQPQVQNSERPAFNPNSAYITNSRNTSTTAWLPDGLPYLGIRDRVDLDRAYRALCTVPQVTPLNGPAYDPPWGAFQPSAVVPHTAPAYNPLWSESQAPSALGSQFAPHGLPSLRNDTFQSLTAAHTTPTAVLQAPLTHDSSWGVSQALSQTEPDIPTEGHLDRSKTTQDSAVREESPSAENFGPADSSLRPIFSTVPEGAAPLIGTEEQDQRTRGKAQKDPTKYEADQYYGNWRPLENLAGPLAAAYTDTSGVGPKQIFATHNGQPGVFWIDVPAQKAVFLGPSGPDEPLRYTIIRITSYPHPTKMHLKLRLPLEVPAQRGPHALHQAAEVGCWIKFRAAMQECTNLWDPEDKHTGPLVYRQWYYRIEGKQPELMDVVRQMVACTRIRPKKK